MFGVLNFKQKSCLSMSGSARPPHFSFHSIFYSHAPHTRTLLLKCIKLNSSNVRNVTQSSYAWNSLPPQSFRIILVPCRTYPDDLIKKTVYAFSRNVSKRKQTDRQTDRRTDGLTDGRTDGQTDGRTDGRTESLTDGRTSPDQTGPDRPKKLQNVPCAMTGLSWKFYESPLLRFPVTDRQTGRWTDGLADRQTKISPLNSWNSVDTLMHHLHKSDIAL